ncbi:hypothetical protein AURDEDRAFT_74302 [Auricularia subglabra TFB-10046 SS5]|uniref:Uncharacterized protein n=1 Tax=Auricularia subglabra (strain TFB-10046 / SS5) TaxID=717982 RepID=J0D982_AURST|nr:hypothetical protein AURDEDRAFT_74302 [Auricularia subglabra TFB-10046 SS5]
MQLFNKDWGPFPHKTVRRHENCIHTANFSLQMCFIVALDDMPRQRFSDSQMQFILWVMSEIGGRNVPSLRALRKFQEKLALQFGTRTIEQRSELGNVFYTNDIRATLAMDAANPQMANHFVVYPVLCPARITNSWETRHWLELPLDFLTPMVRNGAQLYYVNELALLDLGDFVLPYMWCTWKGTLSAMCRRCKFCPHWNVCYTNACLPGALLNQEYFVRFFSTSQHAGAAEQLAPLKEQILSTHEEPYPCYHAGLQRSCKFRIVMQSLPADNPQQSEHCSHTTGARANMYCRRCLNTRALPEDDDLTDWYSSHFKPGIPRTLDETRASVQRQIDFACQNLPQEVKAEQKSSGVNDPIVSEWINRILDKAKEITKAAKLDPQNPDLPHTPDELTEHLTKWLAEQPGDHVSPLLASSGMDPHKHTPIEILHTVLLGLSKYIWHTLYTSWKPEQEQLFATRLQATDISGLTIPPIRAQYVAQYRGALIGKHFKTLTQTMVFHLHDLCSPELFTLVKACGEFSAVRLPLVYQLPSSRQQKTDLHTLINNVLDAYGDVDPLRILDKVKLHLLLHVPDDLVEFGPPVRSIMEIFESFNAVFRLCSVLSNHLAPSRDIALTIADMDRLKHIVSGGYWLDRDGNPMRASENVMCLLEDYPILQRHLGWGALQKAVPGASATRSQLSHLFSWSPQKHQMLQGTETLSWIKGKHVVACSGDVCKIGAFIFFSDISKTTLRIGRIMEIYCPHKSKSLSPFVLVTAYTVANERHPEFGMPILMQPQVGLQLLLPEHIHFIVNVQHDCRRSSGCAPTGTWQVRQERIASTRTVPVIVHKDTECYLINTHAFHNAARLRSALPCHLTAPTPVKEDRQDWHRKLAGRAGNTLKRKKAQTQAKRKVTAGNKKANREAAARERAEEVIEEDEAVSSVSSGHETESAGRGSGVGPRRAPARRGRAIRQAEDELSLSEDGQDADAVQSDKDYAPPPTKKRRRG